MPPPGRRIIVVGTSGSGKTTLAGQLARRIGVPHIELDALHWEPNWTSTPPDRLRAKVQNAIANAPNGWTVCGNYRAVNDAIWPFADTLIWLDYSMTVVSWRIFRRTMRRCLRRETLWDGCRESLWLQFCTKDSIFLWVINTWRIRRRDYPKELRSARCRHLRVIRLRSPRQADQWLAGLRPGAANPTQRMTGAQCLVG